MGWGSETPLWTGMGEVEGVPLPAQKGEGLGELARVPLDLEGSRAGLRPCLWAGGVVDGEGGEREKKGKKGKKKEKRSLVPLPPPLLPRP